MPFFDVTIRSPHRHNPKGTICGLATARNKISTTYLLFVLYLVVLILPPPIRVPLVFLYFSGDVVFPCVWLRALLFF